MDKVIPFGNIHVTTFKSIIGFDFDTVIIPEFDSFKYFTQQTTIIS